MRLSGIHPAFKMSIESAKSEQLTADEMTTLLVETDGITAITALSAE
jgi:hypothetical protein